MILVRTDTDTDWTLNAYMCAKPRLLHWIFFNVVTFGWNNTHDKKKKKTCLLLTRDTTIVRNADTGNRRKIRIFMNGSTTTRVMKLPTLKRPCSWNIYLIPHETNAQKPFLKSTHLFPPPAMFVQKRESIVRGRPPNWEVAEQQPAPSKPEPWLYFQPAIWHNQC